MGRRARPQADSQVHRRIEADGKPRGPVPRTLEEAVVAWLTAGSVPIDMLYERNDMNFTRGRFRVRGDVVEVYPATADEEAIRIEFFGDEIDAITRFDPLTGHPHESLGMMTFFPAKQFVTPADKLNRALTHDPRRARRTHHEFWNRKANCSKRND